MPDFPGSYGLTRFYNPAQNGIATGMCPQVRAALSSVRNLSGTSVSPTIPNTAQAGDVLVFFTLRAGNTGTLSITQTLNSAPTSLAAEVSTGTTTSTCKLQAWYYRLTSSDISGSATVTMNVTVAGTIAIMGTVWYNASLTSPPVAATRTDTSTTTLNINFGRLSGFTYPAFDGVVGFNQTGTGIETAGQTSPYNAVENQFSLNGTAAGSLS